MGDGYRSAANEVTPIAIRNFVLRHYEEILRALGLTPRSLPDDFDLLQNGVIDSLGLMEMISAIENEFDIEIDLGALDAEYITMLGPLANYIAETGVPRSTHVTCA